MVLTRKDMVKVLARTWAQLMNSTKDEAGEECNKWLEHLASNHGIQNWPENMVRVVLEDGPERRMRQSNIVRFTVFCIGNFGSILCAGAWVLRRLARSESSEKTKRAKKAIMVMINVDRMVETNGQRLRYFDLVERKYLFIRGTQTMLM